MVQEFHVLRCFTCESFQVQQVKKTNRWSCKLCGEKQSLLKEFGRGSAADCRHHVQKLNAARGAKMEADTRLLWKQLEAPGEDRQGTQAQSRWSKYLVKSEEEEEEEEIDLMDRPHLHGNNIMNRKRKRRDRQDSQTPGQSNCSSPPSLRHTSPPPSLRHTSPPPSLRHTSPPPSLRHTSCPSLKNTRPVSRWACFLSSDCQAEEEKEQRISVRGLERGVVSMLSCNDVITQPQERPRPLPSVSMFESGEDFSFRPTRTKERRKEKTRGERKRFNTRRFLLGSVT